MDIEKHMNRVLAAQVSDALTNGMGGFELESLAPGAYVLIARETDSTAQNIWTIGDRQGSTVGLARAVIPGRGDEVTDVTIRVPRPASAMIPFPSGEWDEGDYWASIDGLVVSWGNWSSDDPFPIPSGLITLEVAQSSGRRVFRTLDTPPGGSVVIDLEGDTK